MSMRSYTSYTEEKRVDLASRGIYFARGGSVEVLTLPVITNPLANDWQEEDGLEIDPNGFVRTCPYINLRFIVAGQTKEELETSLDTLKHMLSFGWAEIVPAEMHAYHIKNISFEGYKQLDSPLYLKGLKCGEVTIRCQLGEREPNALSTEYTPPSVPLSRIIIGDTDLAHYGIQVKSAYDSLLQPADFKAQTLREAPRELSIECLSIGDTYQQVEHHLYLLWCAIAKKQLYLTHGAGKVRCYYTSMTDLSELSLSNKKGIAFTLNFKTT